VVEQVSHPLRGGPNGAEGDTAAAAEADDLIADSVLLVTKGECDETCIA